MSEFCTNCIGKVFGDVKPDIDIAEEFKTVSEGYQRSIGICEGCGLRAIEKRDGKCIGIYADLNGNVTEKEIVL